MKPRKILILTFSLFLLLNFGCDKKDDSHTYPIDISFTEIRKGDVFTANYNPTQHGEIFTNQNDWDYFVDSIWQIDPIPSEANVNFSKNIVIAVFDKPRTTGGYDIEIKSIVENEQNVVVNFQTGAGDVTQMPTRSYHIVKIPKTTKPITFENVE
jgi:hypothetical protein